MEGLFDVGWPLFEYWVIGIMEHGKSSGNSSYHIPEITITVLN